MYYLPVGVLDTFPIADVLPPGAVVEPFVGLVGTAFAGLGGDSIVGLLLVPPSVFCLDDAVIGDTGDGGREFAISAPAIASL